jgi:hypothetical protein
VVVAERRLPVGVGGAQRSSVDRPVRLASVSLATRGQADIRGLVTAGRAVRLELSAGLEG